MSQVVTYTHAIDARVQFVSNTAIKGWVLDQGNSANGKVYYMIWEDAARTDGWIAESLLEAAAAA